MRDMCKKVLFWVGLYLFLMIFVSSVSFFYPNPEESKAKQFTSFEDLEGNKTKTEQMETKSRRAKRNENEITEKETEPTFKEVHTTECKEAKSTFSFDVNIDVQEEEKDIQQKTMSISFPKTEPLNITKGLVDEMEKRKKYVVRICKRALKMLKSRQTLVGFLY